MGRYFIEERGIERKLYYQPYEGEGIKREYFKRPLFGEAMGLVQAREVQYQEGASVAYQIDGMTTLRQTLEEGVAEEELLQLLIVMADTAVSLVKIGVLLEDILFRPDCVFVRLGGKEVFYILHMGGFPLTCPGFYTCVREVLSLSQMNGMQYGVDRFVGGYLEEQGEGPLEDFVQYLKNIRKQLFMTKSYSGQQSLSCRLGGSNIMIDDLFSIEAPKFSTVKMMEQESATKRAFLVRLSTGEEIEITKAVFTIGKEEGQDYQISDNPAISRRHAEIILRDEAYYIKDLDSTNHTFVDRRILKSPEEARLEDRVTLMFANEMFLYKEE